VPEPEVLGYAPVEPGSGRRVWIGYWGVIVLLAALLALWQYNLVVHLHLVAHGSVLLGRPTSRWFCDFLIYGLNKESFSLHIAATGALAAAAVSARDTRRLAPAIATVLVPLLVLALVSLAGIWMTALRHVPAERLNLAWEWWFVNSPVAVYLPAGLMLCAFYSHARSLAAPVILCVLPPAMAVVIILRVLHLEWLEPRHLVMVGWSLLVSVAGVALLWGCKRYFRIPLPGPTVWWLAAVAGMAIGQIWLVAVAGPFSVGVSWMPISDGRELNLPIHIILLGLNVWFVRQIIRGRRQALILPST
jgi:hypothetical protein